MSTNADADREVIAWLGENAIPVKSVVAGNGFDDLQPLKDILKDVRLVGLGEATHGTREFFQFKHRLLEFLAQEMGFTVFSIEASYAACLKINDYVLYGQGDPAEALAGQGFWVWDTEEVAAMIDWMRRYNLEQSAEKKLKFYGYDVQVVDLAIKLVREYMAKVAPERASETDAILAPVEESQHYSRAEGGNTDPAKKQESAAKLRGLVGRLATHSTRLGRLTSPAEFENALQHARVLLQFQESYGKPWDWSDLQNLRDLYMAENIEYIATELEPDAKIVVWAHNAHIAKIPENAEARESRMMGHHLQEFFGDKYYAFGFSFKEGSFQSRSFDKVPDSKSGAGVFKAGPLTEFTVPAVPEGYLEWYMSEAHVGDYIVDFRGAPAGGAVEDWLITPKRMRSAGSGWSNDWSDERKASLHVPSWFDAMIHISRTTRARPTPTGIR